MSAVEFRLPSVDIVGHANPHSTGNVTLTFMGGRNLTATISLGGMAANDARKIARALVKAADRADGMAAEKAGRT